MRCIPALGVLLLGAVQTAAQGAAPWTLDDEARHYRDTIPQRFTRDSALKRIAVAKMLPHYQRFLELISQFAHDKNYLIYYDIAPNSLRFSYLYYHRDADGCDGVTVTNAGLAIIGGAECADVPFSFDTAVTGTRDLLLADGVFAAILAVDAAGTARRRFSFDAPMTSATGAELVRLKVCRLLGCGHRP